MPDESPSKNWLMVHSLLSLRLLKSTTAWPNWPESARCAFAVLFCSKIVTRCSHVCTRQINYFLSWYLKHIECCIVYDWIKTAPSFCCQTSVRCAVLPLKFIYRRRAFSVAGPMTWNSLPRHLRDPVHTVSVFRRLLKTLFFLEY